MDKKKRLEKYGGAVVGALYLASGMIVGVIGGSLLATKGVKPKVLGAIECVGGVASTTLGLMLITNAITD